MTLPQTHEAEAARIQAGLLQGIAAYVMWGAVPVYWKQIAGVPAAEILIYRIVFTVAVMGLVVLALQRAAAIVSIMRQPRALGALALSAVLIGANWGVFIWAVNSGRILDTSLAYYINPLLSILLGVLVVREKLTRLQTAAVVLACLGVLNQTLAQGSLPLVSLFLAATFAIYGLIRKFVAAGPIEGLLVETVLIMPAALTYWVWLLGQGDGALLTGGWIQTALLIGAGPATAVPLLFFAAAVRRVRLSTMGFLQYIAPTMTLLLGTQIYGEPFTAAHAVTFALIWAALALITGEAYWRERNSIALRRGA